MWISQSSGRKRRISVSFLLQPLSLTFVRLEMSFSNARTQTDWSILKCWSNRWRTLPLNTSNTMPRASERNWRISYRTRRTNRNMSSKKVCWSTHWKAECKTPSTRPNHRETVFTNESSLQRSRERLNQWQESKFIDKQHASLAFSFSTTSTNYRKREGKQAHPFRSRTSLVHIFFNKKKQPSVVKCL